MKKLEVYLEVGKKRVFAGALDWPGWCRSGPDEHSALTALIVYGPRYKRSLMSVARGLAIPRTVSNLTVVERLQGNPTTDFGAPDGVPSLDRQPLEKGELERWTKLLRASWKAFDTSSKTAGSKTLAKGPRGGGRDVAKMRKHVLEAEGAYLHALGGRYRGADLAELRTQFLEALAARVRGELPDKGPRGGKRWVPRFAVRRSAWHSLDHAWEIQDRGQL